jgi:hypothetical protein
VHIFYRYDVGCDEAHEKQLHSHNYKYIIPDFTTDIPDFSKYLVVVIENYGHIYVVFLRFLIEYQLLPFSFDGSADADLQQFEAPLYSRYLERRANNRSLCACRRYFHGTLGYA